MSSLWPLQVSAASLCQRRVAHACLSARHSLSSLTPVSALVTLSRRSLDGIPFAKEGSFALSLWFSVPEGGLSGSDFAFLLSSAPGGDGGSSDVASRSFFAPGQMHVFLPEERHGAFGTLRTILKDDDDPATREENECSFCGSTPMCCLTVACWLPAGSVTCQSTGHGGVLAGLSWCGGLVRPR